PAVLAFLLADEIGHVARLHCRRGYQLQKLQDEAQRGISLNVDDKTLKIILQTSIDPTARFLTFLYTPGQHFEADLFALHLCRNAGFDADDATDAVRWLGALRYPPALKGE